MPDPPGRGSPAIYAAFVLLGLALGILLTVGGFLAWESLRPSPPPPATPAPLPTPPPASPPPAPTPEASPVAEPQPSPRGPAAPTPATDRVKPPAPAPAAPAPPPDVAPLLGQAEAALAQQRYDAAGALFDKVLQQDPQNARARAGKAGAHASAALRRTFVPALTSAESAKGNPEKLDGFEAGDVDVKRAAEVPARIDFEVTPPHVKPGDSFTVRVFLLNTGKKPIRIKDMAVTKFLNGAMSSLAVAPRTAEVTPQQKALLDVMPGVWARDTSSWALAVVVASTRGDTYRSEIVWK